MGMSDDTILYATRVVDTDPDEIDEETLRETFPDADYVKAYERTEGYWLTSVGDEPYSLVCPECGEGVVSGRTIDESFYYRHQENKECKLDVRDKVKEQKREREEERRSNALKSWGVTIGVFALVAGVSLKIMRGMSGVTINGEPMVVPTGVDLVPPVLLVLALATIIFYGLQGGFPGIAGDRR
jgi:hypothetical protein